MNFYRLTHWLGIAAIAAIVVFLGVEILQTARQEVPQTAISKPFKAEDAHFKATFDTELISDAHFLTTVKPDVSEPILPEMGSDAASSFSVEIPVRETDDSWWLDYSSAAGSSSGPLAVSGGSSGTTSDLSFSSPVGGSSSGDSFSSGASSSSSASPSSAAPSSGSTPAAAGGTDNGTSSPSSENEKSGGAGGVVNKQEGVLDWIQQKGIRAGYVYFDSPTSYADSLKKAGLNTALVKGWQFFNVSQTNATLAAYRRWGIACRQQGLHMFAAYNWQPQEKLIKQYRPVVFSDGTEGLFVCPLDVSFWREHLIANGEKIAQLSLENSVRLDGFMLDMEMYGTENEQANKKNYSRECCFCDNCFSTFLFSKGYSGGTLPAVNKKNRYRWLEEHRWLDEYFVFLGEKAEALAQEYKERIRAVNAELLLGVYPAIVDKNWVQIAMMRAFGKDSYPVISFSTDTYGYGRETTKHHWGADKIPSSLNEYFQKYDINGKYVAGYMFCKYTSAEIGQHLIQSCEKADGYWLWTFSQLYWTQWPDGYERLAGGSPGEYLQALYEANRSIDLMLRKRAATAGAN